jgi:hypothetical protein
MNMSDSSELTPAILHLAEDFRRRLGKLDPQQVAIWREMTPARKLQLLFQLWSFALKVAWTTERQWHPDLSQEDLSRRVWRRIHGSEMPYDASTTFAGDTR